MLKRKLFRKSNFLHSFSYCMNLVYPMYTIRGLSWFFFVLKSMLSSKGGHKPCSNFNTTWNILMYQLIDIVSVYVQQFCCHPNIGIVNHEIRSMLLSCTARQPIRDHL